MNEETDIKAVSDIISDSEIEQFYKLLPKIQKAQNFLESINNPEYSDNDEDKLSPYVIELDIDCKVSKKGNDAMSAMEIVNHENKKFYIDFIVKNYKEFIAKFFDIVTDSLTKTCNEIYTQNSDEKQVQ